MNNHQFKQVLLMDREQVEQTLEEISRKLIRNFSEKPLTDWINEKYASEILGYTNLNHLRMVARKDGIKMAKKGKKFYYSLKSINKYIDNGTLKTEQS